MRYKQLADWTVVVLLGACWYAVSLAGRGDWRLP